MAATPTGTFKFKIGNVALVVERSLMEMYPGIETELVTIEYSLQDKKSEAGVYTRTKQRIVDIVGNPFFLAYLGSWWRKHPFH